MGECPGVRSSTVFFFYFSRTKKQIDESHKHLKDIEETLKVSTLHPFKFKRIPFNFDIV